MQGNPANPVELELNPERAALPARLIYTGYLPRNYWDGLHGNGQALMAPHQKVAYNARWDAAVRDALTGDTSLEGRHRTERLVVEIYVRLQVAPGPE